MSKSNFSDYTDMNLYLPFSDMYWINFKEALTKADFGLYIKNTLIVAFTTTIGTVFTTILAAFAFSRLEFKGREMIFTTLLMTMMVPGELYVITNFVTISNTFHWYNTFEALIVPFITDVFYIFFLRQTFKQIPDSLYKAAKVDGCSDLKFLMRVMIPIAMPTLITITILNALGTWNAYVWPRLVTESDHYLVSIALRTSFTNSATQMTDYRLQMAAATIITVPILIVFLFARKYIMRGVGRSGTKG
jgi:ABC-type glycerol-3-phosphate transport system permease component